MELTKTTKKRLRVAGSGLSLVGALFLLILALIPEADGAETPGK